MYVAHMGVVVCCAVFWRCKVPHCYCFSACCVALALGTKQDVACRRCAKGNNALSLCRQGVFAGCGRVFVPLSMQQAVRRNADWRVLHVALTATSFAGCVLYQLVAAAGASICVCGCCKHICIAGLWCCWEDKCHNPASTQICLACSLMCVCVCCMQVRCCLITCPTLRGAWFGALLTVWKHAPSGHAVCVMHKTDW